MLTGSLPPITRRGTYIETTELTDEAGSAIDLTGADIRVEVAENGEGCTPDLTASLDGGVSVVAPGTIQWRFEAGAFDRFRLGLRRLRVLISRDGDTDVVASLTLPVED